MKAIEVFVVTHNADPYAEGGRPAGVYDDEQWAWDYVAEMVALLSSERWEFARHTALTRDGLSAAVQTEFQIWPMFVTERGSGGGVLEVGKSYKIEDLKEMFPGATIVGLE